jgi:hypothetical protein
VCVCWDMLPGCATSDPHTAPRIPARCARRVPTGDLAS